MYRIVALALVVGGAYVASLFVGSVLENRAIARHAALEHGAPSPGVAEASSSPRGDVRP